MREALRAALLVWPALALAAGATAAEPTDAGAPAAEAPAGQSDEVIDTARSAARSTAEWLARGVNGWFGDIPFSKGGSVRDGRLDLDYLQRADQGHQLRLRFNARFRLPNVDKLAYAFIGRDNDREVVTDKPATLSHQQQLLPDPTASDKFYAGLGLALRDAVELRAGFHGGLKPFVQASYHKPWAFGTADLADFRQTFFWTLDDHFGSTTALSLEHAVGPALALRWLNVATLTQVVRHVEWSSLAGAYRAFGVDRLLSLEALSTGTQGSGVGAAEYGLRAKWQQPLHRHDLIGELSIGRLWARPDATSPRTPVWALGASARLRF